MHPHTNILHVPAYSTVLLVWRSTTLMDHPMHLHGLKMSIIDIALPNKRQDCTLSKCKLNSVYDSHEEVRALAASKSGASVLKDTFILPAGGAVVTQIHTQEPSLWYSHCHLEQHHFDGMAFILNVGNYNGSGRLLPLDYPSCETPFLQAHTNHPSCDCYENPNRVLSSYLTANYKCSRDHLCHHVSSRAANLEKYHFAGGDAIQSDYKIPGYGISLISLASICVILVFIKICTAFSNAPDHEDKSETEEEDSSRNDPDINFVSKSQPEKHLKSPSLGSTAEHSISLPLHPLLRWRWLQVQSSHSSSESVQTAIQVIQKKHAESDEVQESHVTPHFFKELNEIFRAQFKLYKPFCRYLFTSPLR